MNFRRVGVNHGNFIGGKRPNEGIQNSLPIVLPVTKPALWTRKRIFLKNSSFINSSGSFQWETMNKRAEKLRDYSISPIRDSEAQIELLNAHNISPISSRDSEAFGYTTMDSEEDQKSQDSEIIRFKRSRWGFDSKALPHQKLQISETKLGFDQMFQDCTADLLQTSSNSTLTPMTKKAAANKISIKYLNEDKAFKKKVIDEKRKAARTIQFNTTSNRIEDIPLPLEKPRAGIHPEFSL